MKLRAGRRNRSALTLIEALVIAAVLAVLAVMILPALSAAKRRSSRIYCVNNLKQLGLSYRIWADDHGDTYPAGVSATNGGAMEAIQSGNVIPTFQVMSNELSTPKILVCNGDPDGPGDSARSYATNFSQLSNGNVSYFANVDFLNDKNPVLIISGDSNFKMNGEIPKAGLLFVSEKNPVVWARTWHRGGGNLGFADGSVQITVISAMQNDFIQTGMATNRLAIP